MSTASSADFVVVVTSNLAGQTGAYNLRVEAPGCVVTEIQSCIYSIAPSEDGFQAAGGSDSIAVTTGLTCPWTAVSNDSFITIDSGAAGVGNGTVNYTVDPNTGPARIGTITIAGATFAVVQEAGEFTLPCTFDALVVGDPTFERPSTATVPPTCPPNPNPPAMFYKAYELTLSGCTNGAVTASTCGTSPCSNPPGTLADTVVFIYRKPDGSASAPGSPIFNPLSPCTNIIAGNNNSCGTLAQVTTNLNAGNFVVVVTSNGGQQTGTFSIAVTAPGCTLSQCVLTIECPANVTETADPGQSSKVVNYPAPTVGGGCPGATANCVPASGSSFPLGTTTVTCTATDTGGNQAQCQFTVTVNGSVVATKDSFLRDGSPNTNEGAGDRLRIQSTGHNRVVVAFDLSGISTAGLQSATLILNIAENSDNWGPTGRLVDANRLLADWTEGNGDTLGPGPSFRGTGEGVTWNCAKDADISNHVPDCGSQWNGGTFAAATAAGVLHTNNQTGDVSWNVTADVLAGATNGWIIKKQNESQTGQVRYYSREGAVAAGNPNLGPRLVLVYQ